MVELNRYGQVDQKVIQSRMTTLGITFDDSPEDRARFSALQDLIAWAIFDWGDCKDDIGEVTTYGPLKDHQTTLEDIGDELSEWAQEWLVG